MNKVKLGIISLGCDKNRYDTEKLINAIQTFCDFVPIENAEYVFINSCAFLASAREELEKNIQEFKDKKIILGGCYRKFFNTDFQKKYPQVIAFIDPKTEPHFRGKFRKLFEIKKEEKGTRLITTTPSSHAYIKIAEGCNRNCSFCLIPYLTGNYKSRDEKEIVNEIKERAKTGIKEIVLVAQDTGLYGLDKNTSLLNLLQKIEKIKDNFWVRLLYFYPETITEDLLRFINESNKILPYFDLPLQHASPAILKKMNRNEKALSKISQIRKIIPDATIRTTVMVGFPGETEDDFNLLKNFLEKEKPEHLTVFKFSPEMHTPAADFKNQVDSKTAQKREEEILRIGLKNRLNFLKKLIGNEEVVVIDQVTSEKFFGRSWHFAPEIDGGIFLQKIENISEGEAVVAKITELEGIHLSGKIIA